MVNQKGNGIPKHHTQRDTANEQTYDDYNLIHGVFL